MVDDDTYASLTINNVHGKLWIFNYYLMVDDNSYACLQSTLIDSYHLLPKIIT